MEHQPAIAANCEVDPLTMKDIEEAIIAQKARCTAKQLKHYKESNANNDQGGTFLIRKAKVDIRSCPKWKRAEIARSEADEGDGAKGPPTYSSRKLTCPVCKDQVETAKMQLFTPQGFRNINCSRCGCANVG